MRNKIISLAGVSRCGKNTFARCIEKRFPDTKFCQLAFADKVKSDLRSEIFLKFGLDSFSEKTEDKNVFRQMLIDEVTTKRNSGQGDYYVNAVKEKVKLLQENDAIPIFTDLRHPDYEGKWIKENNGLLVHIQKIIGFGAREVLLPNNPQEIVEDPICQQMADLKVIWNEGIDEHIFHIWYYNLEQYFSEIKKYLNE